MDLTLGALFRRGGQWPRIGAISWWLAPILFLLWLYWGSFDIWFRADDFPLLSLVSHIRNFHDLVAAMFKRYAQGTIRPLSEPGPFFLSQFLFGIDCLPFRIAVFFTAAADLCLIAHVACRLTGSRVAGIVAPIFWAASPAIISPLTWNSSYNEVQYIFFLLLSLSLFVRYAETGERRFWWWQLLLFVAGFGSLESNVVYPAIAVVWLLLMAPATRRKQLLMSTIPLWGISAAYVLVHFKLAPIPADGIYSMHADARIFTKLWEYWRWAFLSPQWAEFRYSRFWGDFVLVAGMSSLVLGVVFQIRARKPAVGFCIAWFLLTLAPVLPLPGRDSEYYLTGPVVGLALLGGLIVDVALKAGRAYRVIAVIVVTAWFGAAIPVVRSATRHWVDESRLSRNLLLSVQAARATHPDKVILLDSISGQLYRISIAEGGLRAIGVEGVFLTPVPEATDHNSPQDEDFATKVVDPAVAVHALAGDQVVVYRFTGDHLRNITREYRSGSAREIFWYIRTTAFS